MRGHVRGRRAQRGLLVPGKTRPHGRVLTQEALHGKSVKLLVRYAETQDTAANANPLDRIPYSDRLVPYCLHDELRALIIGKASYPVPGNVLDYVVDTEDARDVHTVHGIHTDHAADSERFEGMTEQHANRA